MCCLCVCRVTNSEACFNKFVSDCVMKALEGRKTKNETAGHGNMFGFFKKSLELTRGN